jgi:hypothetical protein
MIPSARLNSRQGSTSNEFIPTSSKARPCLAQKRDMELPETLRPMSVNMPYLEAYFSDGKLPLT